MRRLFLALVLISAPAFASTYDDFSRGIDANNRGDTGTAIEAFTRSIDGGDLAPSYLPSAHFGRARALLHDRRCDVARADLTDAITLRPDFVDAYSLLAEADACLGRDDAALADATAAVRLRPAAGYYFTRTRMLWNVGQFDAALADAELAVGRDPGNAYFALWQAMIALRTGKQVAVMVAADDDWPKPLLDLYAGRASIEHVRRAAGTNAAYKCEADFYIGEWTLARGKSDAGRSLIEIAARECPSDYIAAQAARRELARRP